MLFCQVLFLGFLYIGAWGRFLISSHPCYVLNDICDERHLRRIDAHRRSHGGCYGLPLSIEPADFDVKTEPLIGRQSWRYKLVRVAIYALGMVLSLISS